MTTEPRRTRQGATHLLQQAAQQAAPGRAAKRSAPPTDPATQLAFDALVEAICAWFKTQKEQIPIAGFAALAARSPQTTAAECTGAEQRALRALIDLGKHEDEATWSLLRAFSTSDGKKQFASSFSSARSRVTRKAETAANLLKAQKLAEKKAAAKANKKCNTDGKHARSEPKKAKLVATSSPPRTLPALPELRDELRRGHELQRATATALQAAQKAEERKPRVWLSHIRLTPELHDRPLLPILKGFRGSVFLYIFTNKPIPHDLFRIFPYTVPAGNWLDAWCARAYGCIQQCVPVASFVAPTPSVLGEGYRARAML